MPAERCLRRAGHGTGCPEVTKRCRERRGARKIEKRERVTWRTKSFQEEVWKVDEARIQFTIGSLTQSRSTASSSPIMIICPFPDWISMGSIFTTCPHRPHHRPDAHRPRCDDSGGHLELRAAAAQRRPLRLQELLSPEHGGRRRRGGQWRAGTQKLWDQTTGPKEGRVFSVFLCVLECVLVILKMFASHYGEDFLVELGY